MSFTFKQFFLFNKVYLNHFHTASIYVTSGFSPNFEYALTYIVSGMFFLQLFTGLLSIMLSLSFTNPLEFTVLLSEFLYHFICTFSHYLLHYIFAIVLFFLLYNKPFKTWDPFLIIIHKGHVNMLLLTSERSCEGQAKKRSIYKCSVRREKLH